MEAQDKLLRRGHSTLDLTLSAPWLYRHHPVFLRQSLTGCRCACRDSNRCYLSSFVFLFRADNPFSGALTDARSRSGHLRGRISGGWVPVGLPGLLHYARSGCAFFSAPRIALRRMIHPRPLPGVPHASTSRSADVPKEQRRSRGD